MAQDTLRELGNVNLIDPLELEDDDLVIPTAIMGEPAVKTREYSARRKVTF